MENPFDKEKDKLQHSFFQQLTEAINEWMMEEYPEFNTDLEEKIEEIQRLQNEFKLVIIDFENDTKNQRKQAIEEFKEEINEFLRKTYPDISGELIGFAKKLDVRLRTMSEKDKKIDEKLRKIVSSASLCEDVYKMRDEFQEMKKFMNKFSNKIKKAFEI